MALRVRLVVPVFSPPEWITGCVLSAVHARAALRVDLHLHSADPPTAAACAELARREEVTLHAHGRNRGLSRTWNDGLLAGYADGADVVIITNDYVRFGPGDLDRLAQAAADQRTATSSPARDPTGGTGSACPATVSPALRSTRSHSA
jgi:GT2 family glycosyltransferase